MAFPPSSLPPFSPSDFSVDGFSPAAWINQACRARPPEEALDRFLGDVEMRLQLLAEDVGAALEEASAGALQRIPRALAEIDRVRVRVLLRGQGQKAGGGRVPSGCGRLIPTAGGVVVDRSSRHPSPLVLRAPLARMRRSLRWIAALAHTPRPLSAFGPALL